jgi:2-keto-myo-inositol isomerase
MACNVSRRDVILSAAAAAALPCAAPSSAAVAADEAGAKGAPFGYCLNTSTISGQGLGLVPMLQVAAKAGYQGVEPWLRDIERYVKEGGTLADLRKRIADLGLAIPSAIGFSTWIADDDKARKAGLEAAQRDMETVRTIGGTRIAAPPAGGTGKAVPLADAAVRYRRLLEFGDRLGVVPQLEVWGFSQSIPRLSEAVYVAMETGHPRACVLADVYHLYKGGSPAHGLKLLAGTAMHVLHMNDYPAKPDRATIADAHRIYPGDGIAPLKQILGDLRAVGFRGMLSLELFNRDYWKQDALHVARTGLEKMKEVVAKSLEGSADVHTKD